MNDNCWEKKSLHNAVHPSDRNLDVFLTASVQKSSRDCNEGAPSFGTPRWFHRLGNWVLVRGVRVGGGVAKYSMNTYTSFPALQGFTCTEKLQPTGKHSVTHARITHTQCNVINTHFLSTILTPSNRNILKHTHTHTDTSTTSASICWANS